MDSSRRSPSHKGHMLAWLRCWETSQFGSKDGASGVPSNNRCQQHLSDIYGRDSTGMADQKKIKQKKRLKILGKTHPHNYNEPAATVLLNYKYCSCILARFSSHHTLACISPNLSRLNLTRLSSLFPPGKALIVM